MSQTSVAIDSLLVGEPTRNCVRCMAVLRDESTFCSRCKARSEMKLCRHLQRMNAWRVLGQDDKGKRIGLALTIGEVTIQRETLRYPLLYEDTRRAMPTMPALDVEPGSDILARLILLSRCHVCVVTFLLPETEALILKGEPRIVRTPSPSVVHVYAHAR